MNTLKLLNDGANSLKLNDIRTNKLDSEILLSKVLNKPREKLLINLEEKIDKKKIKEFRELILRRSRHEPIAYILNKKEFWSKDFEVNKYTLIPRPETELMVEKLANIFKEKKIYILDIGTGSGCILISLLSEIKSQEVLELIFPKKLFKLLLKMQKNLD